LNNTLLKLKKRSSQFFYPDFMPLTALTLPYVISAVAAQKKNPSRCSVFVNGEFAFGCSMDLVLRFELTKGKTLTKQDLERLLEQEDVMKLKQTALRYATYKSRTAHEVRRKMLEKEYSQEEAEYAVQFLEEFGYVNDALYAKTFIRDFMQRKPSGIERVRQELTKRGISRFDAEDALTEAFPKESVKDTMFENVLAAASKKQRALQGKEPQKRVQAMTGFLQRQGFSWEIIKKVLAELESGADAGFEGEE
jgi:regulatory protein